MSPDSQWRPTRSARTSRFVPAPDHERREALAVQRVLEVVAHAAVDGHVQQAGLLHGQHPVQRDADRRHHRPAWLDDQLDLGAEVTVGRVDEHVQVLLDGRRDVAGLVPDTEAAAKVVHLELTQRRQRSHLGLELLQVDDLRPDVGVQAAHPDHRRGLHPGQGLRHVLDRHAELRRLAAGRERSVRVRLDAGTDAQQHRRRPAGEPVDALDVVHAVDDDVADLGVQRGLDVLVGLGVAVHDDASRIRTGRQRDVQLAGADDVEAEALAGQHADHRRRRERLRREAHPAARMPGAQAAGEGAGAVAQRLLVDDERRRAELGG